MIVGTLNYGFFVLNVWQLEILQFQWNNEFSHTYQSRYSKTPVHRAPIYDKPRFTAAVSSPSNSAVNQGFTVWCNVEVGDKEKLPEREGFSISISLAWALFEVLPSFESIKSLTNQILLHWKNLRKIAWYWLAFDKKVLFERECYLKIGKSNQKNYSTQNKNLIGVELNSTVVSVTV